MLRTLILALLLVYPWPLPASEGDDALLDLLAGEFALQEGQAGEAAESFLRAARERADARLAERAARVALLAGDRMLAVEALALWRELEPGALAATQLTAVLALRAGEADAARELLAELLAASGEDGWKLAAQALAGERRSVVAASVLTALVESGAIPDALDPLLTFGDLALRLDLQPLALGLAQRASERHPRAPRAWLWRAEVERRAGGAPETARHAVEQALALPDLEPSLRLTAAAQLDALGDPKAAADVLAAGEQDDATLAGRAAYLARAEATEPLAELYAELQANGEARPPERLYLLGQLAELIKQPDQALAWYRQIPAGETRDQAELRIAVVLDQSGELDAAVTGLRALQQRDGDDGALLRNAFLLEAELLGRAGRGDDAMDAYARGLAVFEDDPELLYARALALERLDRVEPALADLRRLLELDPGNADYQNALGYTLADRTDRLDEALELIERAHAQKPDNPAIIDSMGWVLHRLGRTKDALPYLKRAFELQKDAEVAAHLGAALWASGEQDEARSIWRLAEELDADNPALKRVLEAHSP